MEKPSIEPVSEDIDGALMVISPTMFERLLKGDLHEGRGSKSCILKMGKELVAIQSLSSLRYDSQQSLLSDLFGSPEQVPSRSQPIFEKTPKSFDINTDWEEEYEVPLRWRMRGTRVENTYKSMFKKYTLCTPKDAGHTRVANEEERKQKGKGKLIHAHVKGSKKTYGARSVTQNVFGSSMVANAAQTARTKRQREEAFLAK